MEITSNSYLSIYVHFQFNQEFIKKLNLEVGRLRGWIKTPQEAAEEFDITLEEANEYWKSTYELLPSTLSHLLPQPKKEPIYKIESIENNEIGLYENEDLIYKSNMGAVLALTEISLEEIPEDISKNFMNEVFKNSTSKRNLTISNDEVIEMVVNNVIDVKLPSSIEDEMYLKLMEDLLEIYDNGTLYGKRSSHGSMSYSITNHFTDVNEDYKSGKYEGLSRTVEHENTDKRKIIGLKFYRTKYVEKTPFTPIKNSDKFLPIEELEGFLRINRDNYSTEELSFKFRNLINSKTKKCSVINIKLEDNSTKNTKIRIKETSLLDFL